MPGGETTTIVIVGASGDLTSRKLLPALFNLWLKGRLPGTFNIVGMARSAMSDGDFRDLMWNGVAASGNLADERARWEQFAARLRYCEGDLGDLSHMARLGKVLGEVEGGAVSVNRLFFLSIAPTLYARAVASLGSSGLANGASGWSRVVIEKPFGWDLGSAQELNGAVHAVFDEGQVYRIDHYLGKETVQNLLVFRFGQRNLRAHLEPELRRQRPDHRLGEARSWRQGRVLRQVWCGSRHDPEPPPSGPVHRGDGASHIDGRGLPPQQEGRGAEGRPPRDARGGLEQCRARAVQGLQGRGGSPSRLDRAHLRRPAGSSSTTGDGRACPSTYARARPSPRRCPRS